MRHSVWYLTYRLAPAVFVLSAAAVRAEVQYEITDLGTFDGDGGSEAYAINDLGQVTGLAQGNVFLWDDGVMTDLGFGTWGYDINESTQIVGALTGGGTRAFLWEEGNVTVLGNFGGNLSVAYGVNDYGQIAGWAANSENELRAFIYSDGAMTDLGAFGGPQSWAFAVNNAAQVVGSAETTEVPPGGLPIRHAFIYSAGQMTPLLDVWSEATDINDLGQVVGSYEAGGFLWENGQWSDLGLPYPRAINNHGQVVGTLGTGGYDVAYLWENGVATNLFDLIPPGSGWTQLYVANDINDSGQIVGWGELENFQVHGFLLTPVPEPASVFLLAIGAVYVMRRRR